MHLRSGQAGAGRILHRLDHVGHQTADVRRPRIDDRLGTLQQDGMTHAGDFQDGHGDG